MNDSSTPILKDLVLIGGGHSHVTVLKKFGMRPMPGVQLTVICRDVHTPYSGMLPGLIAGHYSFDAAHIDLGPLTRFAGARLYHDEAVGIDFEKKSVRCQSRPDVPYDVVSINIGSTPSTRKIPGAPELVVPVKPINNFVSRWENLKSRVLNANRRLTIVTVGAGAGGVELTLAIQFALRRLLEAADRADDLPEFHLLAASDDVLQTHNEKVRRKFRRILSQRRVQVHTNARVKEVISGFVRTQHGSQYAADEIVWVTEAGAAPWIAESGLAVDADGFALVDVTLQSMSHPGVFAAGDIASISDYPREKAGVFAVRQGPPLEENLRRCLLEQPLRPFTPQKDFLSLISTGDKYAVASRGRWAVEGKSIWQWKDWIDRRFMNKYNVLPDMDETADVRVAPGLVEPEVLQELSAVAMRCGGCGAKVGSTVLSRVLAQLSPGERPDVLVGLADPDDAAVLEVPAGKVTVQTVDSFRALVADPHVFGKITANHSLGDIFGMGATPQSALAIATVPYAAEDKIEDTLLQMLSGAIDVLKEAGAVLVGGHTSEGAELSLGLAIQGLIDREQILRKSGLRPGDALVLTKAVGTGTLFAADMRLKAKGRWIAGAIESMLQSNQAAAKCLQRYGATACTDVTGFGLLGHLVEMTRAADVGATVSLRSIPILAGADETVAAGIVSSLQPQNVRLRRAIGNLQHVVTNPLYPLLFDPQTAGGLLAGIPQDRADECVTTLQDLGYGRASVIGRIVQRSDNLEPIRVDTED